MARVNTATKGRDHRVDHEAPRLAGGYGPKPAKQTPEALLRRSVMACLLWEDTFYEDGVSVAENIKTLVPQVDPDRVSLIAIDARHEQKLRHVPLLLAREMARHDTHKGRVADLLPRIIRRADEITEFVALYWQDDKNAPLSAQVKKGLAQAFNNFDAYQFAKYNRPAEVKFRDVMFLTCPKPAQGREELFKQIAENTLPTPDTWESAGAAGKDKKETFERLIAEKKLGAMAFLRNLRGMYEAGVSESTIIAAFEDVKTERLLPKDFYAAAQAAPRFERQIERLMLKCLAQFPKLRGKTIFVIDVSGSMRGSISAKSQTERLHVGAMLALLAGEMADHCVIYATAGNDRAREHKTVMLKPHRGFAIIEDVQTAQRSLGGGGIFTRQCIEWIAAQEGDEPVERMIFFTDSQDCDHPERRTPVPFGRFNYICDVSAHAHGVAYKGVWSAEISGWSEHFLSYIAAFEGQQSN